MNSLVRCAAMVISVGFIGSPAAAATPFDGTSWPQVLAKDSTIKVDPDFTPQHGTAYYDEADHLGGIFYSGATVMIGQAGGEWLAAVPLDSGGSIGISGWLIYAPHRTRHIAVVSGSLALAFKDGKIVTLDARGPHVHHVGLENVYSVRGTTVTKVASRTIRE